MKNKKKHIGVEVRITSLIIFILLFSMGVATSLWMLFSKITVKQFFYNESSNLDYVVCLKDNQYFDTCQPKNKQYVSTLIDYIDATFKYTLNTSDLFDYTYKYYITAEVVATEKGDSSKGIYNPDSTILISKEQSVNNSNSLIINESIKIDYDLYNELIKSFKQDYTLSLDSKLIITMHISFDGKAENINEDIKGNRQITMTIPLSEQTIDIDMNYNDINDSQVIESKFKNTSDNIILYIVCFALALLDIIFIIKLMRLLNKITVRKTIYEKTIDKIMKEYNQIIVETKNIPSLENTRIIEVKSFEELLDAREMIGKPILYIKVNNQKSCFMISNGDEIYKYILKAVDLEK